MTFSKIPTVEAQESIKSFGFEFLEYIPQNTYVVSVFLKMLLLLIYLTLVFYL